ncbi:MAG: site-specific integrase, partial [Gammaproteobacteria bacterium]|nr:site-specific integrase [Gammaproteobacteria bacterium]
MANIKFRRGKYQVQIRRKGYPDVYRTFTNQSVAKKWIKATEADMERQLFQPISGLTLKDILDRYQQVIMVCHKSP